jgi:hypothetical protein
VLDLVGAGLIHKFDSHDVELITATDVPNDLTIVECYRCNPNEQRRIVMDACRFDLTGRIAFSAYEKKIPIDFIVWFAEQANLRLREPQP